MYRYLDRLARPREVKGRRFLPLAATAPARRVEPEKASQGTAHPPRDMTEMHGSRAGRDIVPEPAGLLPANHPAEERTFTARMLPAALVVE